MKKNNNKNNNSINNENLMAVTDILNSNIGDTLRMIRTISGIGTIQLILSREDTPDGVNVHLNLNTDDFTEKNSESWAVMLTGSKLLYDAAAETIKRTHPDIDEEQMEDFFHVFINADAKHKELIFL